MSGWLCMLSVFGYLILNPPMWVYVGKNVGWLCMLSVFGYLILNPPMWVYVGKNVWLVVYVICVYLFNPGASAVYRSVLQI